MQMNGNLTGGDAPHGFSAHIQARSALYA